MSRSIIYVLEKGPKRYVSRFSLIAKDIECTDSLPDALSYSDLATVEYLALALKCRIKRL